jgi:hypothetical protein
MAAPPDGLVTALADRYDFERELGSGGMAIVYLAIDRKHSRQVALKVLRPELAASLGADRFLREIQIAAKLTHPHILPLYDSGEAGGFLYYVMPYVEGETLRGRLQREGSASPTQVARIAEEVAGALDYAHRNGVVHRDIKPENILLEDGHAVVADFGVARAVSTAGGEQLTHTGLAVGTPLYMSPEQAAGDTELDGRSDIYSLACVVYEMISGSAPFTGNTPQEILAKRLTQTVPPLSERVEGTPPDLEQALMKALASDPGLRFERAGEFAEAVAASRHSPQSLPRSQSQAARKKRLGRRLAIVGAVVAVAALSVVIGNQLTGRAAVSSLLEELAPAINAGDFDHVYARVREAGIDLGSRSAAALVGQVGGTFSLETDPAGATVSITRVRPIDAFADRSSELAGRSPIDRLALVAGEYLVALEHARAEDLVFLMTVAVGAEVQVVRTLGSSRETVGMVFVPAGSSPLDRTREVEEFAIDKFEVTNTRYAAFVMAGGYADASFWPETLVVNGRAVPWQQGVATFVDRTGLPGPRRWSAGRFPAGMGDHPVVGVSWYEASAFARWAGGALPTMDEWYRAALGDSLSARPWGNDVFSDQARANFGLEGTEAVGSYLLGVSVFGCFDMAGNVREWLAGVSPDGIGRTAVGGGWQDPVYMFEPDHAGPTAPDFARGAIGFRIVRRP